jgi:hypothetical protein
LDEETNDDPMLDNRGRLIADLFDQILIFILGWYTDNANTSNFATSVPKNIAFRPTSGYNILQQVINSR